ncbi:MAG: hypothetical protein ACI8RL_000487 [Cyclobacteriaceae bacterium]|jgi:hypothetical protein
MKSRLLFHTLTHGPFAVLFYFFLYTENTILVYIGMLIHSLLVKPIIDYHRLQALNINEEKEYWKCFNPLFRFMHYHILIF